MDMFCVAGTFQQAEQPNYLAKGQSPIDEAFKSSTPLGLFSSSRVHTGCPSPLSAPSALKLDLQAMQNSVSRLSSLGGLRCSGQNFPETNYIFVKNKLEPQPGSPRSSI
eukprot:1159998-Pelagomonas_calceolata.AAC.1